ncbi:MAG: GHKL domain-containing protein [Clostridiales bacterium]|nr:GHKL domain-containing protein [Clostridiales bacterium]
MTTAAATEMEGLMYLITATIVFLRFCQTLAYISLFIFSFIKLKEPKRKRIAITITIYVAAIAAYFAILIFFGQKTAEILIVPVEIGLCLILLSICSSDGWPESLFVMFTMLNTLIGISYLSDLCAPDSSNLLYQSSYLLIRTILFGGLLLFNFKYLRPRFRRLVDILGKEWHLIAVAAFLFYLMEAVIQYYPQMYWYEADNRWYLSASSYLLFLGVYWLIFQSISTIVAKFEVMERENILSLQNKMWEEHINEQKAAINAARRDRHDLRHHYDTLLSMLEEGKIKEVVSYLNMQTKITESMNLSGFCEHNAANAILSRWAARARDNGIITKIEARIPESLPIEDVTLVGILANAFENAVEGCLRTPEGTERFINANIAFSIFSGVKKLHIEVENSCEDNLKFEGAFPVSNKPGGGTGTKSIMYATERYNGMVEFTAESCVFRMRALLHL